MKANERVERDRLAKLAGDFAPLMIDARGIQRWLAVALHGAAEDLPVDQIAALEKEAAYIVSQAVESPELNARPGESADALRQRWAAKAFKQSSIEFLRLLSERIEDWRGDASTNDKRG